jgi:uncharacterized delta-60 repeat protein
MISAGQSTCAPAARRSKADRRQIIARAIIETLENRRLLSASTSGAIDHTFGVNGVGTIPLSDPYTVYASTTQSDGKILAVGTVFNDGFDDASGTGEDFALVRFNKDGTPDGTFGSGGAVTTDFGADDEAHSLAIQPDGKIVVAGSSNGKFAVARYNTDGTLDTGFGSGGKVTTDLGDGDASVYGLALSADGKIIVSGDNDTGIALARYNADGSLDGGFGNGGTVVTGAPAGLGADATIDGNGGVALTPTGRILVVGDESDDNGGSLAFAYYDTGGNVVSLRFGPRQDDSPYVVAFALQGKKILTVNTPAYDPNSNTYSEFSLERHNGNGSLDKSFAHNGRTSDLLAYGSSLVVQSDGRILVTGQPLSAGFSASVAVARFNADGSDDATFGVGGVVFSSQLQYGGTVAVAPDGGVIATGIDQNDDGFSAVRFRPDLGVVPPTAVLTPVGAISDPNTTTITLQVTYSGPGGIDGSTLGDDNLSVTDDYGDDLPVTFGGSVTNADGSITATYTVQKDYAGHYFTADDNGNVTVSMAQGAVLDNAGTPVPDGDLGTFAINIAPPPGGIQAPTAVLAPVADVTAPATTDITLSVTYDGQHGIDKDTLSSSDLLVNGPHGFQGYASFTGSTDNADGSVTATYTLSKDQHQQYVPADNGTYTVIIQDGTISDGNGNTINQATLGKFRVNVPAAPAGAAAPTATLVVNATSDALSDHTLVVTYKPGSAAIAQGTLDSYDLTVSGSDGSTRTAMFQSATVNVDGSVTAVYQMEGFSILPYPIFYANSGGAAASGKTATGKGTTTTTTTTTGSGKLAPPNGGGDVTIIPVDPPIPPPGGDTQTVTFTVSLNADQVSDTAGTTAAAATLGTFTATVSTYYGYGGGIYLANGGVANVPSGNTGGTPPASKPIARGSHAAPTGSSNAKLTSGTNHGGKAKKHKKRHKHTTKKKGHSQKSAAVQAGH